MDFLYNIVSHEQAFSYALDASAKMRELLLHCDQHASRLQQQLDRQSHDKQRLSTVLSKRNSVEERYTERDLFREETDFLNQLLSYAIPLLREVNNSLSDFNPDDGGSILIAAKKSFFTWKASQENNEKYFRKGFKHPNMPKQVNSKRNILGVEHKLEWLENLNIGTLMQMRPLKYHDYASKKDLTYEITHEALQQKVIRLFSILQLTTFSLKLVYVSLCFFTIATEMRFSQGGCDIEQATTKVVSPENSMESEWYKRS